MGLRRSPSARGLSPLIKRVGARHHRRRRLSLAESGAACRAGGQHAGPRRRAARPGAQGMSRRVVLTAVRKKSRQENAIPVRPRVAPRGRTAELRRLLRSSAFDMGGTSTDFAMRRSEFELAFDTESARLLIRAPMMRNPHRGGRRRSSCTPSRPPFPLADRPAIRVPPATAGVARDVTDGRMSCCKAQPRNCFPPILPRPGPAARPTSWPLR